jgi:hypothetical protein
MNYANEPLMIETEEDISTKTIQELVKRYESIVYDYLAIMNSSETLKSIEFVKYAVQLGLTTITHIYKMAFCLTKNVSTTADYCQKGIYCFIEYIEQTHKLGASPFDFADAVVFIYDKTISDLKIVHSENSGGIDEQSGSSSVFANILSVSQSHQAHGTDFLQCKTALEHFGRIAAILMWTNHPLMSITDQMEIIDSHLIDFLEYSVCSSRSSGLDKDLFLFLETVQECITGMDKKEYMDFLAAIKKQMKKHHKSGGTIYTILPACLYLKTMNGMTLKEVGEQEKWKNGVNDLAKLPFHFSL